MKRLCTNYIRARRWTRWTVLLVLFGGLTVVFLTHSTPALIAFLSCVTLAWMVGSARAYAYLGVVFRVALSFSTGGQAHWTGSSKNSDFDAARVMSDVPVAYRSLALWSLITGAFVTGALLLPVSWWIKIPAAYLVWCLPRPLRLRCAQVERNQAQLERNERATRTLKLLSSDEHFGEYFLYLRPFHLAGKIVAYDEIDLAKAKAHKHPTEFDGQTPGSEMTEIPVANVRAGIGEDRSDDGINPDLEEVLERGVRRYGSLIALGQPGDAVGAGRILTGETEWQQAVKQLGSRARAFIVMPALNAGTRWEIDWLKKERNFRDCLFLMPGLSPGFDGLEYWKRTSYALQPLIELPRLCGPPALFCFDKHGAAHVVSIAQNSVRDTDGIVFFAAVSEVRHALRVLLPIASGTNDSVCEELVKFGRFVAGEMWKKHGVCAWVDNHPARSAQPRIGTTPPDLAERPIAITWHARRLVALEFRACEPMQSVSLVVHVKQHRGDGTFVGYGVNMDDADLTALEEAPSPSESGGIRRTTLLRVEIPVEKLTGRPLDEAASE